MSITICDTHLVRTVRYLSLTFEPVYSADVCFLTFFGFYLGIERMLIALYISVLLGFLWILYKKTHLIN